MDRVFKALADPSRRLLLDLLRERDGRTLGELASALPQMTRFGVSNHLDVLEAADLISAVKVGREKRHHLNAVPLQEIQNRWLTSFTARQAQSLLDFRTRLEQETSEGPSPGRVEPSCPVQGQPRRPPVTVEDMSDVSSSAWVVRRAAVGDLNGLVALTRHDSATEPASLVDARIAGLLDDPMRCVLVAAANGVLVGVTEAQFYGVAMRRAFGSARLHDLFVEPSWRRHGIAGNLFAGVTAWARLLPECRYLEWQSSPSGLAFYEQMGLVGNEADDSDKYPFFEIEV